MDFPIKNGVSVAVGKPLWSCCILGCIGHLRDLKSPMRPVSPSSWCQEREKTRSPQHGMTRRRMVLTVLIVQCKRGAPNVFKLVYVLHLSIITKNPSQCITKAISKTKWGTTEHRVSQEKCVFKNFGNSSFWWFHPDVPGISYVQFIRGTWSPCLTLTLVFN